MSRITEYEAHTDAAACEVLRARIEQAPPGSGTPVAHMMRRVTDILGDVLVALAGLGIAAGLLLFGVMFWAMVAMLL